MMSKPRAIRRALRERYQILSLRQRPFTGRPVVSAKASLSFVNMKVAGLYGKVTLDEIERELVTLGYMMAKST